MTSYNAHLADTELHFDRFLSIIVGHVSDAKKGRGTQGIDRRRVEPNQDITTVAIAWVIDNNGATTAPLEIVQETI